MNFHVIELTYYFCVFSPWYSFTFVFCLLPNGKISSNMVKNTVQNPDVKKCFFLLFVTRKFRQNAGIMGFILISLYFKSSCGWTLLLSSERLSSFLPISPCYSSNSLCVVWVCPVSSRSSAATHFSWGTSALLYSFSNQLPRTIEASEALLTQRVGQLWVLSAYWVSGLCWQQK